MPASHHSSRPPELVPDLRQPKDDRCLAGGQSMFQRRTARRPIAGGPVTGGPVTRHRSTGRRMAENSDRAGALAGDLQVEPAVGDGPLIRRDVAERLRSTENCSVGSRVFSQHLREQRVPQPIAAVVLLSIRRIFAPILADFVEHRAQLVTTNFEQRADQHGILPKGTGAPDPRESNQSGATKKLVQNRFNLIVRGVGSGHTPRPAGMRLLVQESVTLAAEGILARAHHDRSRSMPHDAAEPKPRRKIPHKRLVSVTFLPPHAVVVMGHDQPPRRTLLTRPPSFALAGAFEVAVEGIVQQTQQCNAVSAPADRDHHGHTPQLLARRGCHDLRGERRKDWGRRHADGVLGTNGFLFANRFAERRTRFAVEGWSGTFPQVGPKQRLSQKFHSLADIRGVDTRCSGFPNLGFALCGSMSHLFLTHSENPWNLYYLESLPTGIASQGGRGIEDEFSGDRLLCSFIAFDTLLMFSLKLLLFIALLLWGFVDGYRVVVIESASAARRTRRGRRVPQRRWGDAMFGGVDFRTLLRCFRKGCPSLRLGDARGGNDPKTDRWWIRPWKPKVSCS